MDGRQAGRGRLVAVAGVVVASASPMGPAGAQEEVPQDEAPPVEVTVDAGGPYEGVVGEPIALHGTVTGAGEDPPVLWSEDAESIPCTFGDAESLDATITCDEPIRVGIVLQTSHPETGDLVADVADIRVVARPGTTAPPTAPTTTPATGPGSSSPTATASPTPPSSPGELPKTGSRTGQLVFVGSSMLVAGILSMLASQRRRLRV
jgi:LPXTG-motif cell wall-anchored protein